VPIYKFQIRVITKLEFSTDELKETLEDLIYEGPDIQEVTIELLAKEK